MMTISRSFHVDWKFDQVFPKIISLHMGHVSSMESATNEVRSAKLFSSLAVSNAIEL